MKKLILAAIALTTAAGAFAQGTVIFSTRVTGSFIQHVYAPLAPGSSVHQIGNGSNDTATGSTDWTGYTLIGAGGTGGQFGAATVFAQLLAANGSGQAEGNLLPALPTTTFRTGTAAGNVAGTTATLVGVPENASIATLEMVAWDNSSGLYPTWLQASTAWANGLIAAGKSGTFNVSAIGGTQAAPTLNGMQSFNLYYAIPEPTSFALAGLGAAALMIFRRRK